jgi:protein transport protein SEC24
MIFSQAGSTEAEMLVVSDLDDVFLPKPTDLLVNLTEARASLEALLGRLGDMFKDSHSVGSAAGPALQAGYKLIVSFDVSSAPVFKGRSRFVQSSVGGKLVMLSASLPSLGPGALKVREESKILGTAKVRSNSAYSMGERCTDAVPQESALLQPASSFYKTFAIDCSRAQVSVDMFLFSALYQDVATLCKFSFMLGSEDRHS